MDFIDYSKHLLDNQKHITEVSLRDLFVAIYQGDILKEGLLHWHDAFECIYVKERELSISIGLNQFHMNQGEMILINSDVIHELKSLNDTCHIISVVFHPFFIASEKETTIYHKYIKPIVTNPSFQYYLMDSSSSYVKEYLKVIHSYEMNVFGYEIQLRNLFSLMFVEIVNNLPFNPEIKQSNYNAKVARLRIMSDYIRKNYYEQLTLKDISNNAVISESECLRCFKTMIHTTPIRYLIDYRLLVASDLLTQTNRKIESICLDVGFLDFSYFTKAFKKKYGISPRDYRKEFQH